MIHIPDGSNDASMRQAVTVVFMDRFRKPPEAYLVDWITCFPSLESDQSAELETLFSEDEIVRALKDTDGDKAPSPDGFSFRFA